LPGYYGIFCGFFQSIELSGQMILISATNSDQNVTGKSTIENRFISNVDGLSAAFGRSRAEISKL